MIEDIKKAFKRDKFAEFCGIEITEAAKGRAVVKMDIREHHLNGLGTVHGGALFTLADLAFAVASNSHGTVAVGINANINYMKAVTSGTLYAYADEMSVNPKLGAYTVHIKDENSELIAIFQGLVYRKKNSIFIENKAEEKHG